MALSFVRWLHKVCGEDETRDRPYAGIYPLGPAIEKTLGIDGEFDMDRLALMLREKYPDAAEDHLGNLIRAESYWRMETLDLDPGSDMVPMGPLPSNCGHTGLDGVKCEAKTVPGAARCFDHGGSVLDPGVRRSMLLIAYSKMMRGSSVAVDALMDVAEHSNNDLARVHAAREILDRVGLVHEGGAHQGSVDDGSTSQDEAVEALKKQLATAKGRLQLVAVPAASSADDDEPVDAEIVE